MRRRLPRIPGPREDPFLRSVTLVRERAGDASRYPWSIPAIRALDTLEFHPLVTFLVGENGSGKSTLLEAVAMAAGFNPEGGSRNFHFALRPSESELHRSLRFARGVRRPATGYFLRAESFFNVATQIEETPDALAAVGFRPHERSHGEAFLELVKNRFWDDGLYVMDEPEAALSPQRQLALLRAVDDLARGRGCQFVVATHSPILLAYPEAHIYLLSDEGIARTRYEDTEHYWLTLDFLQNRERYLRELMAE